MKNKERFFITGGMGYLSSAFAKEALKKGHDVCLYDSLIYEQNPSRMIKEISENKKESSEFKFIIGDTAIKSFLNRLWKISNRLMFCTSAN